MKTAVTGVLLAAASLAHASTIALWDFESATLAPTIGQGTAAAIGGTVQTYGVGNGSTNALRLDSFPVINQASGTAGVQFNVDTTGFENVSLRFDYLHAAQASRYFKVQASADGTTFQDIGIPEGIAVAAWRTSNTIDLSTFSGSEDNSLFTVRIVTVFRPGSWTYEGVSTGYQTYGAVKYDNVTFTGSAVPEPTTTALLLLALAAGARRRKL